MSAALDISVVIPAFNAAGFIEAALQSAIDQVPAPVEIVVVDDGSTDNTGDLVSHRFPQVRLVSIPHQGEAAARNAGLRSATGEWVAFLDADDWFLPGRLAAVSEVIASAPDLAAVTTDAYMMLGDEVTGRCYGPEYQFEHDDQATTILKHNFVFGHVVVRRQRLLDLGGFDESISHTTDWAMWTDLLADHGRIGFVDQPLSVYRVHTGSASADARRMAEGSLQTLRRAAGNERLTVEQRRVLEASIEATERRLAGVRLDEALEANDSNVGRFANEILRDGDQRVVTRGKASVARIAPRLARLLVRLARRNRRLATAGWLVDADQSVALIGGVRPLVTVVLPFLDERRYLADAVESVGAQTMGSWELMLVDDGSTDGSEDLADQFADRQPDRISVLRHPGGKNRGLAASRNLGIDRARGGIIAFLDADDRWEPDKLDVQVRHLSDHPEIGMIAGPTRHRFVDESRVDEIHPVADYQPGIVPIGRFARDLVRERVGMPPPPSTVAYRSSVLRAAGGVPCGDSLYEDQRTYVAASVRSPMLVIDDVLCTYARRGDSLYGRLGSDNITKAQQRRTFEWWVLRSMCRVAWRVPSASTVVAGLVTHRFRVAARRRILRFRNTDTTPITSQP